MKITKLPLAIVLSKFNLLIFKLYSKLNPRKADFETLWDREDSKLSRVQFDDDGLIDEEGAKYIEMDFANKYIGGGVLGHGLVQEEIRFIVAPELIVTLLLTEELSDDECLGKVFVTDVILRGTHT